jgi:hypothetical protein
MDPLSQPTPNTMTKHSQTPIAEHGETPIDIIDEVLPPSLVNESTAEELLSESPPLLTDIISMGDPTIDIHEKIANRYQEDNFFTRILEQPQAFKNFELSNGRIFLKDNDRRILCIPDVLIGERRVRELLISHAHSILAHLGPSKTLTYLRENVWWKEISADVKAFCESCPTCQVSKPTNHQPYGLLETLDVPSRPWEMVGVDFVGPLPESKTLHGVFDMILVAIDHLTAMVHLAPTKQTYRAKDIAEVMFNLVYKLHGMPSRIVSDRDTLFTSTFWQKLNDLTGTELRMSTSFHPQTDGITERANRTITQMLRQCVSPDQRDWAIKLPAIEFAINSASSASRKEPPFVLIYGRQPPSMIWNVKSEYPGVRVFAQRMKDAVMSAHDAIIAARVKSTTVSNRKRKEAPFVIGDLVYLSTVNLSLPKGRARKLAPKFIGPFKILKDYRNNSYLLDLPSDLKQRGLHPAFHAHLLRIHIPNDDRRFPGRQLNQVADIGSLEEWSVSRVTDHNGQGTDSLFEIEYSTGDRVWLPYHEVSRLEVVSQYLEALGVPGIQHLPRKITHPPSNIPVATINNFAEARDEVFNFVDCMLENLPAVVAATDSGSQYIRTYENLLPFTPLAPSRLPHTMSFTPAHTGDAMIVDHAPIVAESGEISGVDTYPPRQARRNGRGRRNWQKERGNPSFRRESNADAMSAFTRFFRAEAQASKPPGVTYSSGRSNSRYFPPKEELAVRKEAHAFDRMLRAERGHNHSPRPSTTTRGHHRSLDNRNRHHRDPPRNLTTSKACSATPPVAPLTVSQVIEAANLAATRAPSPILLTPAPAVDPGRDVTEIIADAKALDDMSTEDFIGRVALIGLFISNLLTLFVMAAAFGSLKTSTPNPARP